MGKFKDMDIVCADTVSAQFFHNKPGGTVIAQHTADGCLHAKLCHTDCRIDRVSACRRKTVFRKKAVGIHQISVNSRQKRIPCRSAGTENIKLLIVIHTCCLRLFPLYQSYPVLLNTPFNDFLFTECQNICAGASSRIFQGEYRITAPGITAHTAELSIVIRL